MPQMSPLLWMNLYVFFSITFLMIMIMLFFIKPPVKMKNITKIEKTFNPNWKW
uniref:ATP synthase F0 subunit 8 n=1 Tax=Gnathophyllum americanum TaxID=390955 RepID=UPI0030034E93